MPRKKLSQEEIEVFRSRAIVAAEKLFSQGGLGSLTMRELARELGCSATTPYRYFESHEELVAALRASVFSRFSDRQGEAVEELRDPLERLERIGRTYFAFALQNPDGYRLMFSLEPPKKRFPELEAQSRRSFSHLRAAIEDAVEAGVFEGQADTLAHLFWAQLHGLVSLHFSNKLNFGKSLEELVEAFLGTLIDDPNGSGHFWRSSQ